MCIVRSLFDSLDKSNVVVLNRLLGPLLLLCDAMQDVALAEGCLRQMIKMTNNIKVTVPVFS